MSFIDTRTGYELIYIRQILRLGMPHFEIYRLGKLYCTVKKRFSILTNEFDVQF